MIDVGAGLRLYQTRASASTNDCSLSFKVCLVCTLLITAAHQMIFSPFAVSLYHKLMDTQLRSLCILHEKALDFHLSYKQ
jgi:hypothetical protein